MSTQSTLTRSSWLAIVLTIVVGESVLCWQLRPAPVGRPPVVGSESSETSNTRFAARRIPPEEFVPRAFEPPPREPDPPRPEPEPLPLEAFPSERPSATDSPLTLVATDEAGAPLAGVELLILERDRYDRLAYRDAERALAAGADELALLRQFAVAATTDETGRAPYWWGGKRGEVYALAFSGRLRLPFSQQSVRGGMLTLRCAAPRLIVQVTDVAGGAVSGVGVALFDGPRSEEIWRGPAAAAAAFLEVTDGKGALTPTLGGGGPVGRVLRLDVVSRQAIEAPVAAEHWEGDPLRLVLPSTATVRVEVVDGEGRAVDDEALFVTLGLEPLPTAPERERLGPQSTRRVQQGAAEFPWVEVGSPLHLLLQCEARGLTEHSVHGGATTAGESLVLRVVRPEGHTLALRVVGPAGFRLSDQPCGVRLEASYQPAEEADWQWLRTDREGRLAVGVPSELSSQAPPGSSLEVSFEAERRPPSPHATVEVDLPLSNGVTDLGSVHLSSEPLLLSGIVLDPSGAPLASARVRVRPVTVSDTIDESPWGPLASDAERLEIADRQGRFTFYGRADGESWIAAATAATARTAEPLIFWPGSEDVVLQTAAAGQVAVRLSYLRGFAESWDLRPRLRASDHHLEYPRQAGAPDRFTWEALEPGTYSLEVTDASGAVLVTLDELLVPAGGACDDPRLASLDLSEQFDVLHPRVFPGGGTQAPVWWFRVRFEGQDWAPTALCQPRSVFVPRDRPFEARIEIEGQPHRSWAKGSGPLILE
jgi:hypothetical protein